MKAAHIPMDKKTIRKRKRKRKKRKKKKDGTRRKCCVCKRGRGKRERASTHRPFPAQRTSLLLGSPSKNEATPQLFL